MTENKFSLEDILSEYPSDGESPDEAALDDILSSYPATRITRIRVLRRYLTAETPLTISVSAA